MTNEASFVFVILYHLSSKSSPVKQQFGIAYVHWHWVTSFIIAIPCIKTFEIRLNAECIRHEFCQWMIRCSAELHWNIWLEPSHITINYFPRWNIRYVDDMTRYRVLHSVRASTTPSCPVRFLLVQGWNRSCNLFLRSVQLWTWLIWLTILNQSKAWPPRKLTATLSFWSFGTCATYNSICPINESSDSFMSPLNTSGLLTTTFCFAWAGSALPNTRSF